VERVYGQLRDLAISFALPPGDRVDEMALAGHFGVSRTPLREALHRLTADGFLTLTPGKGFYQRRLDPAEVFQLFEFRARLECAAMPLAVARAGDAALRRILDFLNRSSADVPGRGVAELVALDEDFHEQLITLSGNAEMLRVLRNVNARIRFVRWIHMEGCRSTTQGEHKAILAAVAARDTAQAVELLNRHIEQRMDRITAAIREGYGRIYMDRPSGPPPGGA
jgi:DNA-binding GntR family transcriptional regulator